MGKRAVSAASIRPPGRLIPQEWERSRASEVNAHPSMSTGTELHLSCVGLVSG